MYIRRRSVLLCAIVEVHLVCNCAAITARRTRLVVWVGFYTFLEGTAFEMSFAPVGLKMFSLRCVCCAVVTPKGRKGGWDASLLQGKGQSRQGAVTVVSLCSGIRPCEQGVPPLILWAVFLRDFLIFPMTFQPVSSQDCKAWKTSLFYGSASSCTFADPAGWGLGVGGTRLRADAAWTVCGARIPIAANTFCLSGVYCRVTFSS